jgi:hypothetical protein
LPALAGLVAYGLYRTRPRLTILLAFGVLVLLSWISAALPLDAPFSLLGISIPVYHSFSFLGRQFDFLPALRPALLFLLSTGAFFMLGTLLVPVPPVFFPVSLVFLSLMASSLFIQPFLYASIFLFLAAALFSVTFTNPLPGVLRGLSRLLVFTALGIPFLLLAGTELTIRAGLPPDAAVIRTLVILLGLGFAFLLGIPPFHFWQADLSESKTPYPVAFLLSLFIGSVFFFLLRFLGEFQWLRDSPLPFDLLRGGGLFLCVFGAGMGLLQERFGRLMAYTAMVNLGVSLLMLSSFNPNTLVISFSLLVVRSFSLWVWGISADSLRQSTSDDSLSGLSGSFASHPLASSVLLLSGLSLTGFPGLIAFPGYWAALRSLSSGFFPTEAQFYIIVVSASLMIGMFSFLRFGQQIFKPRLGPAPIHVSGRLVRLGLSAILVLFFLLGIFPQLLYPLFNTAQALFPVAVIP